MMLPTDMALKTDPVFAQHAAAYELPPQSPRTMPPQWPHSYKGTQLTSSCSSRTSGQGYPGPPVNGVSLTVFSATRSRGFWLPDVPPCAIRRGNALIFALLFTPHTSHLTPHTSHPTPNTSHLTPHTSHLTPHTPHLTPHTSHLTPHTVQKRCCFPARRARSRQRRVPRVGHARLPRAGALIRQTRTTNCE